MFSLQEHYHGQAEVLLTFVGPPNLLQRCQGVVVYVGIWEHWKSRHV
jgi:hypothetical protein